ncbi:MAG: hypothetical protein O3B99_00050 [Proteobacteria bacterium]|nr:hypothetical protein [Pseudomonadota bacterium]MDA1320669.1 hypothetical protein [Pseudomonadota bacterium]
MLGILIHSRDLDDAKRLIADNDAFNPDRIVRRCLHWWLMVFDDAQYLEAQAVTARLIGLREFGKASYQPKLLSSEATADLLAALSQPKVGDLTPSEERGMMRGYRALADRGIIGHANAAAHKAWVTMKVERWMISKGLFSHSVSVTANIGPHRETVNDKAVSKAHADRKAAKMRKDMRERFGIRRGDKGLTFETNIARLPVTRSREQELERARTVLRVMPFESDLRVVASNG